MIVRDVAAHVWDALLWFYDTTSVWRIPEPWRLILNTITLFLAAYTLILVGLNLRRSTELGRRLATNELVFGIIYAISLLSMGLVALGMANNFFRSDVYALIARGFIIWSTLNTLHVLRPAFGGWRLLHRRAWYSVCDWVMRRPHRDDPA